MRFILHGSGSLQGIQIDWDVPVELGDEIRAAMAPHDVDQMQAGILRRGYQVKRVLYPRGSIALRIAHGHEIFLQLPAADELPVVAKTAEVATASTVEPGALGEHHRIVVGDAEDGERTDVIIARATTVSRATAQRLIDDGHVTVGGEAVRKANQRLKLGDVIDVDVPPVADALHRPNPPKRPRPN